MSGINQRSNITTHVFHAVQQLFKLHNPRAFEEPRKISNISWTHRRTRAPAKMDQLFPNTPFVVPFPPVPPNYIDSPSRAPLMIAIGIAFCSMSFIFVAFRIYTRWFITKRVYIEDWLSVVAWALSVFYVVCNALCTLITRFHKLTLIHLTDKTSCKARRRPALVGHPIS